MHQLIVLKLSAIFLFNHAKIALKIKSLCQMPPKLNHFNRVHRNTVSNNEEYETRRLQTVLRSSNHLSASKEKLNERAGRSGRCIINHHHWLREADEDRYHNRDQLRASIPWQGLNGVFKVSK